MTSGRHAGGYPNSGGRSFSRRGEASADDPGHEIDLLLAQWADERGELNQHAGPGLPGGHAGRHGDLGGPGPGEYGAGDLRGYGPPPGGNGHGSFGPDRGGWESAGPRYAERPAPAGPVGPSGGVGYPHPLDDGRPGLRRQPAPTGYDLHSALLGDSPARPAQPGFPSAGVARAGGAGAAGGVGGVGGAGPMAGVARAGGVGGVGPMAGIGPFAGAGAALLDEPDPGLLTHRAAFHPDGGPLDYQQGAAAPQRHPWDDPFYPDDPDYDADYGPDYGAAGDPRRGRHRRSAGGRPRWLKAIAWIVAVVGLLGAAVGGWGFYQYRRLSSNITRVDVLAPNDPAIRQAAKQRNAENFLLIGSDTRAGANSKFGDVSGARSDTTILAHLSPGRDKALLVSFPRDSWVDLPACQRTGGGTTQAGEGMFNSAFELGGPKCTVLAVQKLTGISVNHYVQVDFAGFQTMVDALDGVTICSTEDVYDKYSGLRLRQGNQVLRGEQALAYVRARKNLGDGSDLGRIQRQQRFLGAMIRKATSSRLLFNPLALTRFLDAATKSLTLDRATSLRDLKGLGDQLRNLDPKRVTFLTAPIANQDYSPPGTSLRGKVKLDDIAGRRLWDSIINDKPAPPKGAPKPAGPAATKITLTVAPADVPVRVLNGVGVTGLAARTAAELTSLGFAVSDTGNAPLGVTASVVRYAPSRLDAARTLAAAVPGSVLQEDASLGRTVQFVIGANYHGANPVQVGDTVAAPSAGKTAPTAPPPTPAKPVPSINAADTRCA